VPLTKEIDTEKIGTEDKILRLKYVKDAVGRIVIEDDRYYKIVSKMETEDLVVAIKLTDFFKMHRVFWVLIECFRIDPSFWGRLLSEVRMDVKFLDGLSTWHRNMMDRLDDEYRDHTNEIVPLL